MPMVYIVFSNFKNQLTTSNVVLLMKKALFILLLLAFALSTFAQQEDEKKRVRKPVEKKGIIYNNELSGGIRLLTNGWGVFMERSKILNIRRTRVLQWGFSEVRDYKQRKQSPAVAFVTSNGVDVDQKDFFFGKQNNFYTFRFGYGYRHIIADKAEKNGVRVSISYIGGLTVGVLKPYYLELAYPVGDNQFDLFVQPYIEGPEGNEEVFLDIFSINSAAGFRYGFRELEPVPGGYGKLGLTFDWAGKEEFIKALEAGVMVDVYYKNIKLMVNQDNRPFFLAAYLSFQFGKRW